MSTIRTTTLAKADGSSSVPVDTVINGTAKAWVNFNGVGTLAIRTSFNVTSVTDVGVGQWRVNFTTAMTDANFCATAGGNNEASNVGANIKMFAVTASSFEMIAYENSVATDKSTVMVVIHR